MSHLGRLGTVLLVALVLAGCGDPAEEARVKQAVTDFTHAYLAHDVKTFCRKTVISTYLPQELAKRMQLPYGKPGTLSQWDRSYRDCVRTFGKEGEFDRNLVSDWKVRGIEFGPRDKPQGVARSAHVDIRTKDKRAKVWFVKFRGDWKFVFPGT